MLKQNTIQDSAFKNPENKARELFSVMNKWDIKLPRGVEIYVY